MAQSNVKESNVDVLIVGAGPAGLMAAVALAKNGVNVRIIDKRPSRVLAGHADALQSRTLEVLQSYGLAERFLAICNQVHQGAYYNPSPNHEGVERTFRGSVHSWKEFKPRYPFGITQHQGEIENQMADALRSYGGDVERPVVPLSIELSKDQEALENPASHPVKVELSHFNADDQYETHREIVHAKFVLGSDGAHSWVRRSVGITMDADPTELVWGVLDIDPDSDFPDLRNICSIRSTAGSSILIPREDGAIRVYVTLEEHADLMGPDGKPDRSKLTPERLLEVAAKIYHPYRMQSKQRPKWWTLYKISQGVATRFSVNERVFIAGDACHTHSPKAGQGMNASMLDSHNLAWKLTYVLRGLADMSLLKTYEFERRKFAQELIEFDKSFSKLFSTKGKIPPPGAPISDELKAAFQRSSAMTTGLGIHYDASGIVDTTHQAVAPGLRIGYRVPPVVVIRAADARPHEIHDILPADARFKLVLFSGDLEDESQLARIRAFAETVSREGGFLKKIGTGERKQWLDVITIAKTNLESVEFTDVPEVLREHWSTVYTDDLDASKRSGGELYSTYGIGPEGAVAVVRPDGWVGTVLPLEKAAELDVYFERAGLRREAPLSETL